MIKIDKTDEVKLVTDPVLPAATKPGSALVPGDVIAVPFAGYGKLLAMITNVDPRGKLIDVTVADGSFGYTTVVARYADVPVFPVEQAGTWR